MSAALPLHRWRPLAEAVERLLPWPGALQTRPPRLLLAGPAGALHSLDVRPGDAAGTAEIRIDWAPCRLTRRSAQALGLGDAPIAGGASPAIRWPGLAARKRIICLDAELHAPALVAAVATLLHALALDDPDVLPPEIRPHFWQRHLATFGERLFVALRRP